MLGYEIGGGVSFTNIKRIHHKGVDCYSFLFSNRNAKAQTHFIFFFLQINAFGICHIWRFGFTNKRTLSSERESQRESLFLNFFQKMPEAKVIGLVIFLHIHKCGKTWLFHSQLEGNTFEEMGLVDCDYSTPRLDNIYIVMFCSWFMFYKFVRSTHLSVSKDMKTSRVFRITHIFRD